MATKNDLYQFSSFVENFSNSNGRNCRSGTVIVLFENYTINSLIRNKFETNFIMSKALLGIVQLKQNKNPIIIING